MMLAFYVIVVFYDRTFIYVFFEYFCLALKTLFLITSYGKKKKILGRSEDLGLVLPAYVIDIFFTESNTALLL